MDLKALLTGPVSRLKVVQRFNNSHRHQPESVAEHCFFVAYYAMAIAQDLVQRGKVSDLNWQWLMVKALVHDLDEGLSGDFPRNFKYSNPRLVDILNEAAAYSFREMVEYAGHAGVENFLHQQWREAKLENEGRIVAFADLLSCLSYVWHEVQLGNRMILVNARDLPENISKFRYDDANAFLSPLPYDALCLVQALYR